MATHAAPGEDEYYFFHSSEPESFLEYRIQRLQHYRDHRGRLCVSGDGDDLILAVARDHCEALKVQTALAGLMPLTVNE